MSSVFSMREHTHTRAHPCMYTHRAASTRQKPARSLRILSVCCGRKSIQQLRWTQSETVCVTRVKHIHFQCEHGELEV